MGGAGPLIEIGGPKFRDEARKLNDEEPFIKTGVGKLCDEGLELEFNEL